MPRPEETHTVLFRTARSRLAQSRLFDWTPRANGARVPKKASTISARQDAPTNERGSQIRSLPWRLPARLSGHVRDGSTRCEGGKLINGQGEERPPDDPWRPVREAEGLPRSSRKSGPADVSAAPRRPQRFRPEWRQQFRAHHLGRSDLRDRPPLARDHRRLTARRRSCRKATSETWASCRASTLATRSSTASARR